MNYIRRKMLKLLTAVLFICCFWIVIQGKKTVGYSGLGLMVLGLCGLIILLYVYNRSFIYGVHPVKRFFDKISKREDKE